MKQFHYFILRLPFTIFVKSYIHMRTNNENRQRRRAFVLAFFGIVGLVVLFWLKPEKDKWFQQSGVVWNTEYNIKYWGNADLSDSILAVFRRVELSVSPFNKESLVTALNENRTDSVDELLKKVYLRSVEINRESQGAFDPTVSPLVNAWGFGYKTEQLPDAAAIDSIMQFVGIGKTRLKDGRMVKDDSRITFNFSAIAKGMGSDEVGRMLERNGVDNYLVEIGGEIVMKGKNPQGEKWHVSVDKPVVSNDTVVHESAEVIAVSGCGIATSGNYRNYKVDTEGRRYAHTISPAMGRPVQSDVLSATVVASDCMSADAYATAFMVMGSELSKKLIKKNDSLAVMLILADGSGKHKIWQNERFRKLVE